MSSEMNKKLVERARNAHTSLGQSLHFGLCAELADHIEKLDQQLAELRGMREEVLHYQREFHKTRDQLSERDKQVKLLRDASQKLIDRWDSPLWKDQPHTANYIHALREALAATEPKP